MKMHNGSGLAAIDFSTMFSLGNDTPSLTTSLPTVSPTLSTTPAATSSSWLDTLSNTVKNVLPGLATTALGIKQQNDLNKINVARAQAGQPPLDIAQYQEASAPVIKVQGGVDSGTSTKIMYGVLAAAGLYMMLGRKR